MESKKQSPLSPSRLPLIVNRHQLGGQLHQSLWQMSKKYGPIVRLKLGSSFRCIREEEVALVFQSISQSAASKSPAELTEKPFFLTSDVIRRVTSEGNFEKNKYEGGGFQREINEMMSVIGSFAASDFFPYVGWIIDRLISLKVNEDDVGKLEYLNMVVKETWRLHPPAPLLVPIEVMSLVEVNGYKIYPKTRIHVNVWAIERDPQIWKDPEEFLLDRFAGSPIDFNGQHFQLLPFSGGCRICPDINMTITLVQLTLANLLHCFDWKLLERLSKEDINMDEAPGITLHKKTNLVLVPVSYV
ncbi:cytochrome P450 71B34-like [Carica papaya]|uniref:cytochrome P450 71B34-like n=1 Tax=Carica papaya TaxID=3649 RepID=UPI000B8CA06E|nr:cytochrome P450 71B34-like [Carica papaya]